MNVGVVIPFYQRESGILPRALASIRDQELPQDVQIEVIIVDDQSPVPAAAEMAAFTDGDRICWHRIGQPNAGPGAARNAGIDWLESKDIRYLAFLDSDDEWHPNHLANAVAALETGGDFYFSDHSRIGECESYFTEVTNVRATMRDIEATHGSRTQGGARMFAPGAINQAMLRNYLSQTSTVVLRRATLGDLRFDPELRHAGEDYMLWLRLALNGARICISNEVEVVCGAGINMYHGSYDWDSSDILNRLSSEIIFHQKLDQLQLGAARSHILDRFQEVRRLYAYLLLRKLAKRNLPTRNGLLRVLRHDPLLVVQIPMLIARFLLHDRPLLARSKSC